jgi:GNAT superfamily N-acetyltransferase
VIWHVSPRRVHDSRGDRLGRARQGRRLARPISTGYAVRLRRIWQIVPLTVLPRDERPRPRRHNEDVYLTVLDGLPAYHEAAVRVWHAANFARLPPPGGDRVARIWEKIAEPEACLVIGHLDADRDVVAMALAEPGRVEHGAGAVIPGYGHVSMVFVHPDMWGRGIGRQLLHGLHERASKRGWSRTTLWTWARTRALNACT